MRIIGICKLFILFYFIFLFFTHGCHPLESSCRKLAPFIHPSPPPPPPLSLPLSVSLLPFSLFIGHISMFCIVSGASAMSNLSVMKLQDISSAHWSCVFFFLQVHQEVPPSRSSSSSSHRVVSVDRSETDHRATRHASNGSHRHRMEEEIAMQEEVEQQRLKELRLQDALKRERLLGKGTAEPSAQAATVQRSSSSSVDGRHSTGKTT